MQIEGLDEYTRRLDKLSNVSDIIKKAVYVGGGIVAQAIKEEMNNLPTDTKIAYGENKINDITPQQKEDLKKGFGISPMSKDGDYTNVKIGWDGYGSKPTKKYPKGVPNQLIARSVNSGTSFRKKNPFVNRAVNRVKKKAQEEMGKVIDEEIKKEMR